MGDHPLARRCAIHASKMNTEGWYTTANVLGLAADRIRELESQLAINIALLERTVILVNAVGCAEEERLNAVAEKA